MFYKIFYLLLISFKQDLHGKEEELHQEEKKITNENEACSEAGNKSILEKTA